MNKYQNKNKQTENRIVQALLSLMKTHNINQITMNEISETAGLNRVTLYRHFSDKWDIIEQIEENFFNNLIVPHKKMIEELRKSSKDRKDGILVLAEFLKIFEDNLPLLSVLMGNNGDLGFNSKLTNFLLQRERLSHPILGINVPNSEQELFSYYGISGLVGILNFWTIHPLYTSKKMAEFFFTIRTNEINGLMNL